MYVSEDQIEAVVKALKDNEYRLSDGYCYYYFYKQDGSSIHDDIDEIGEWPVEEDILKDVAKDIITKLNEAIYNGI